VKFSLDAISCGSTSSKLPSSSSILKMESNIIYQHIVGHLVLANISGSSLHIQNIIYIYDPFL
jgi:hypothetical protein